MMKPSVTVARVKTSSTVNTEKQSNLKFAANITSDAVAANANPVVDAQYLNITLRYFFLMLPHTATPPTVPYQGGILFFHF